MTHLWTEHSVPHLNTNTKSTYALLSCCCFKADNSSGHKLYDWNILQQLWKKENWKIKSWTFIFQMSDCSLKYKNNMATLTQLLNISSFIFSLWKSKNNNTTFSGEIKPVLKTTYYRSLMTTPTSLPFLASSAEI